MLLAVDVGNTNTVLGVFEGEKLIDSWRVKTDARSTSDELALLYRGLLHGIEVTGISICSTVPSVLHELRRMTRKHFPDLPVTFVEPGTKTGVPLLYDNPREVGADRIVNTLAAHTVYGGPAIVVDFGTSTNFDVVGKHGEFLGGVLAPGIEISMDALAARGARLFKFELARPRSIIGKTTVEAFAVGHGLRLRRPGRRSRAPALRRDRARRGSGQARDRHGRPGFRRTQRMRDRHRPRPGADADRPAIGVREKLVLRIRQNGGMAAVDEDLDLNEQERVRREKLARILDSGREAYPVNYPRTTSYPEVRAAGGGLEPDTITDRVVGVVGRVVQKRGQGKIAFAALQEGGETLQVVLQLDRVGQESLDLWFADVDYGDHVGVTGFIGTTKRGELSVFVETWAMTAKALRPLPDKHAGLTDLEARARQRYVDLIVRPEARAAVEARAAIIFALRSSLNRRGFIEVETPVLQHLHGGAARPFKTHMNALDLPLYLRTNLELHLKKLIVGGLDKVYEISKNFRNEGVDSTHNPEFTMLEAYQAYADYDVMATEVREWIVEAAAANGSTVIRTLDAAGAEVEVELDTPWKSITMHGAVSEAVDSLVSTSTPAAELRALAAARGVALKPGWGAGEIVVELFEQLVEDDLIEPTYVRDFPIDVRPLARVHRDDPGLTEAWDLYIGGKEVGVAYSELNDPVEQRRRLVAQALLGAGGDVEAMDLDEDFLRALETGMPPTGGMGMGIDRLVMTLTGLRSIREVVLFPLVRPE